VKFMFRAQCSVVELLEKIVDCLVFEKVAGEHNTHKNCYNGKH